MRYFAQGYEPLSRRVEQLMLTDLCALPKSLVTGGEV